MVNKTEIAKQGVKSWAIFITKNYMFKKIENIKKKIRLAKIWAIIFAIVFVTLIGATVFQQFQIMELSEKVSILNNQYLFLKNIYYIV